MHLVEASLILIVLLPSTLSSAILSIALFGGVVSFSSLSLHSYPPLGRVRFLYPPTGRRELSLPRKIMLPTSLRHLMKHPFTSTSELMDVLRGYRFWCHPVRCPTKTSLLVFREVPVSANVLDVW
jgi:hypothetical protein